MPAESPPDYPPEVVRAAMDKAVSNILRGSPTSQTVGQMTAIGLDAATAAVLYAQVLAALKGTRRRTAALLMLSGGFWLAACVAAYGLARYGWGASPSPGRALALLAAIAGIQLAAGFFRWRQAARL